MKKKEPMILKSASPSTSMQNHAETTLPLRPLFSSSITGPQEPPDPPILNILVLPEYPNYNTGVQSLATITLIKIAPPIHRRQHLP